MTVRTLLRHTFPGLDLTTPRLYRALVAGRWHIIPAHDVTDALRAAQAEGEVAQLIEVTR